MSSSALSYLETYPNKRIVRCYQTGLKRFFKAIYGTPDLTLADRYISETRDHEKDVATFFIAINNTPPKSIQLSLSIVKTFYMENRIDVDDVVCRRMRRRITGKGAVTQDTPPTQTELRQIITQTMIKKAEG